MNLIAIAAVSDNGVIGKDGKIPWSIPEDLIHFRNTTMGRTVVMGRKTYESLKKPLDGRKQIILTRSEDYKAEGCTIFNNLEKCINYLESNYNDVYIAGGAEIYELFMPYLCYIHITRIHKEYEGDTFFPTFDGFYIVGSSQVHDDYSIVTYAKKMY